MAADDDDDDMEWPDIEKIQYPESDEDKAEYEFPELEMGFDLRRLEEQKSRSCSRWGGCFPTSS